MTTRCDEAYPTDAGIRCIKRRGHVGPHIRGSCTWLPGYDAPRTIFDAEGIPLLDMALEYLHAANDLLTMAKRLSGVTSSTISQATDSLRKERDALLGTVHQAEL